MAKLDWSKNNNQKKIARQGHVDGREDDDTSATRWLAKQKKRKRKKRPSAGYSQRRYVIVGKPTAKIKQDGKKITVQKKAHILENGRTLCNTENAYKKIKYTTVHSPQKDGICRICLLKDGFEPDPEPDLAVLLGEKMA